MLGTAVASLGRLGSAQASASEETYALERR